MMKNEILISVAILIFVIVVGVVFFKPAQPTVGERLFYKESSIVKNKEFQLQPGQNFFYKISGNYSANFTFIVERDRDCVWLYPNGSLPLSCVNKYGNDDSLSNVSLKDPTVFFFKPWMLALHDNWKWKIYGCIELDNTSYCDIPITFQVIRVDYIQNKKNYVVAINFSGKMAYDWVEDERRILTKEVGEGYEATLIEPSPALQQEG